VKKANREKDRSVYPRNEERLHIITHAVGFAAGLVTAFLLVRKAAVAGGALRIVSFSLFGLSIIVLYAASTLYHSAEDPAVRRRLKVFDHAAIYLLIAGTYTPFSLIVVGGTVGWVIFSLSWGAAAVGIVLKLFFIGRFRTISTVMYVLMGWLVIFFYQPIIASLHPAGLRLLTAGGAAYTAGAVLYLIRTIPYNHALFHLFVLAGTACHAAAVLLYV
jgi:hemolysin III